jgi:hypothetical protein
VALAMELKPQEHIDAVKIKNRRPYFYWRMLTGLDTKIDQLSKE